MKLEIEDSVGKHSGDFKPAGTHSVTVERWPDLDPQQREINTIRTIS